MKIRFTNRIGSLCLAAVITSAIAGCSSTDEDMVQSLTATDTPTTTPVDPGPTAAEREAQRRREQLLAVTVFYFDFDKSELKPQALEPLRAHAEKLKQAPALRVRLEGHADERGTPEYNLALGERRALAVRNYLMAQGVSTRQLEVISYGEERPVARGTGESNWAQNRRVELKYPN